MGLFQLAKNAMKQPWPPIAGSIGIYIIQAGIAMLLIAAIVLFIKRVSVNPGPVYEHFEASSDDGLFIEYKKRIPQIQSIKDQLETDIDALNDMADDTCNIMSQIQDIYVGNSMAPSDEEEYNLPQANQTKLQEARKRRAVLRFEDEKKQYMALNNRKTILECFSADQDDLAEAEQTLSDAVTDLIRVIDTAEVRMAAEKGEKIDSLLGFNAKYLKKALDAATLEGFMQQLKGTALIAKADELIGQAITVHNKLIELRKNVDQQKRAAKSLNVQAANLDKGIINPTIVNAAFASQM
jgi:hypothetical protein